MPSSNNLPRKTPQFFKIILENTMRDGKLGIPRKFVKEYGNALPECVTLEVPDGAQWQIHLTKTEDGQVWLEKGWLDFAKHYYLSHGNFLVFDPQGLSKFLVVIFDITGLEIKYAPMNITSNKSGDSHFDGKIEMTNVIEVSDSPILFPKTHKRERVDDYITTESGSSVGTEYDTLRQKKTKRDADVHVSSTRRYKSKDEWKNRRFTREEKAKMLERARVFHSSKPYFKVVIHQTACYREDSVVHLNVPTEFSRKYLTHSNRNVVLQNEKGRTWSVEYNTHVNIGGSSLRTRLARGWKDFSVDNNLEVGDVCVFEMINDRKMTFNVVIFRSSRGVDMSKFPGHQPKDGRTKHYLSSIQKAELFRQAGDCKSTKPHFKVIMQSSSIHRENKIATMNVPAKFAKKYFTNEKGDVVIHNIKGQTWFVSYRRSASRNTSQVRFGSGWEKFMKDNNLRIGDVCVFEMENCEKITFKVIVFRRSDSSPVKSDCTEYAKNSAVNNNSMLSDPDLREEANKSTEVKNETNKMTKYPWFTFEMNCTSHRWRLNIPRNFARDYIKTGASTIILKTGGKSWQVKLIKHQDGYCILSAGWSVFAKENSLQPMDICNLELIQMDDYVFRVSISRKECNSSS